MERILGMLALNALAAALIAVPAFVAARRGKHAVAHALWVLLLAKLLVPAAIGVRLPEPILTRSDPPSPAAPAVTKADVEFTDPALVGLPTAASPLGPPLVFALFVLEVAGALTVIGIAAVRFVRFRRLVRGAGRLVPAPQVLRIAGGFGLRSAPRVRLVPVPIAPALWPGPPCEILIPAALWQRLDARQRDALLAHELAHVRRRDHWVRPLELLATAITWWYPLTWWARGQLRASEEACCDALALTVGGAPPRTYAGALIETLSFLARSTAGPVPALATGAGEFPRIRERFAMILRRRIDPPPSRAARAAILALGLAVLLVGPGGTKGAVTEQTAPPPPPEVTAAAPEAPTPPDAPEPQEVPGTPAPVALLSSEAPPALLTASREGAFAAELDRLRVREMELQHQIEEIEVRRARLELEMQESALRSEALRVQREAEELEGRGREEEAKLLREQLGLFESQILLHRAHLEAREAHHRMEMELREKAFRLEQLQRESPAPAPEPPRHR